MATSKIPAKKQSSAPSSAGSSPAQTKSLGGMIVKEGVDKETQMMQLLMEMNQKMTSNQMEMNQIMTSNQTRLEEKIDGLRQEMTDMRAQMVEANQNIQENKKQIQETDVKVDQTQKELEELREERKKAKEAAKTYADATLTLEMDRAALVLRFRNIPEDKDTDVIAMMEEALAELLEVEKSWMSQEIDQVYRVNSSFARRNKVPRELQVVFVRRRTKEEILRKLRDKPLKIKEQEIQVLKQIPWKIRDRRREYTFLTSILNRKQINFRWLTPEGILINWQARRYRLDTPEKAMDFHRRYFSSEEGEEGEDAKGETEEERRARHFLALGAIGGQPEERTSREGEPQTIEEPNEEEREGREIRGTRALNPRYKY